MLRKLNFKTLFCLFLLVLSLALLRIEIRAEESESVAETLRFAAWNMKELNVDKVKNPVVLAAIVSILLQYDFIAITELNDENALIKVVASFPDAQKRLYRYTVSPKLGREDKEQVAFLFNENKVRIDPNQPGKVYPDGGDRFYRDPYWANFTTGDDTFDFSVIVVHLYASDIKETRKEVMALGRLYNDVQKENQGENDVLLVGDFNLDPCDEIAFSNLMSLGEMSAVFDWTKHRSDLKDKYLYDNILFQSNHLRKEYTGQAGVFPFDEKYFNDNDNEAARVSDHRPVWANFKIHKDDDKGTGADGSYGLSGYASTLQDKPTDGVYYNPRSHKYHTKNCGHSIENSVLASLEKLRNDCYAPCNVIKAREKKERSNIDTIRTEDQL